MMENWEKCLSKWGEIEKSFPQSEGVTNQQWIRGLPIVGNVHFHLTIKFFRCHSCEGRNPLVSRSGSENLIIEFHAFISVSFTNVNSADQKVFWPLLMGSGFRLKIRKSLRTFRFCQEWLAWVLKQSFIASPNFWETGDRCSATWKTCWTGILTACRMRKGRSCIGWRSIVSRSHIRSWRRTFSPLCPEKSFPRPSTSFCEDCPLRNGESASPYSRSSWNIWPTGWSDRKLSDQGNQDNGHGFYGWKRKVPWYTGPGHVTGGVRLNTFLSTWPIILKR